MRIEAPVSAMLRVDLDALASNYRLLKKQAAPAECSAVVKANAYGLGMVPVARRLLREGCTKFFVATLAEAAELRALTPDASIYVLEGAVPASVDELVTLRATPVLASLEQIERWRGHGRALLHIDTGMTRLGLSAAEVRVLAARLDLLNGIELEYVITHLACADEPAHPQNRAQLRLFDELRALLPPIPTSIGNSAATFIDAAHRGDLVRPGLALYGGNPFAGRANPMTSVATYLAPVLQIRDIEDAVSVGYGATYVARPPARLAVVGSGYADGYPRSLSNRGIAALHGLRVPVVGRVSMDLICIDISALPPDSVRVGDFVELIGPTVGVDEVAEAAGTISYEILTGLGMRLVRQYVQHQKS